MILAPSILSLDYAQFSKQLEIVNEKCKWIHFDVMDGNFVSDYQLPVTELRNLIQISKKKNDVHLMVENPKEHFNYFIDQGVDRITFHIEACKDKDEVLENIRYLKENGVKVGLAVNPDTEIDKVYEFLPYIHMVLVMSVVPGKGGQSFMPVALEKLKALKKYCDNNDLEMDIEVDGGINDITGKDAVEAGANILVSGSYVVNADDFKVAIESLKNI